jgi:hypothetical protein
LTEKRVLVYAPSSVRHFFLLYFLMVQTAGCLYPDYCCQGRSDRKRPRQGHIKGESHCCTRFPDFFTPSSFPSSFPCPWSVFQFCVEVPNPDYFYLFNSPSTHTLFYHLTFSSSLRSLIHHVQLPPHPFHRPRRGLVCLRLDHSSPQEYRYLSSRGA